jgi:hypothetical protein
MNSFNRGEGTDNGTLSMQSAPQSESDQVQSFKAANNDFLYNTLLQKNTNSSPYK